MIHRITDHRSDKFDSINKAKKLHPTVYCRLNVAVKIRRSKQEKVKKSSFVKFDKNGIQN